MCIRDRQNTHYMKNIYNDMVASNTKIEDFNNLCVQYWSEPHGFLTIDLTKKAENGKYRNKFNDIVSFGRSTRNLIDVQ